MTDKRSGSSTQPKKTIKVETTVNQKGEVKQEIENNGEQLMPVPVPKNGESVEKHVLYLIDDWKFKTHRLNIVGVYDETGYLQGGMYIVDDQGNPTAMVKPEDEQGVLFQRLCDYIGIKSELE